MNKKIWIKVFTGSSLVIGTVFGCSQYLKDDIEYKDFKKFKINKLSQLNATPDGISITDIYNFLKKTYPSYDGITYGAPTTNILRADNWLLQTPNIWGYDLNQYNEVFWSQESTLTFDPCFNLPQCNSDTDCRPSGSPNFPASCETPNFLTNEALNCPNTTSTPAGQKLCLSNAHKILTNLYNDIINAQYSVDITMLNTGDNFLTEQQFDPVTGQPTGSGDTFFYTLKQALTQLSKTATNPITVRLLGGSYSSSTTALLNTKYFIQTLTKDFASGNKIKIVAVPERSCPTFVGFGISCDNPYAASNDMFKGSWDHGKNVVVDQKIVIAGGENLWGGDYLNGNPTNDAYIRVEGPIAKGGTTYNDTMFGYLASLYGLENKFTDECWIYENGAMASSVQNPCSSQWSTSPELETGALSLNNGDISAQGMFVSKLNGSILDINADQSEPARVFAISHATQSVKIAQQSLFIKGWSFDISTEKPTLDGTIWPEDPGSTKPNPTATIDAIAAVFFNNVKNSANVTVNILTTAFSENDGYGADVTLNEIYTYLCKTLTYSKGVFKLTPAQAQTQLSTNLKMGYVSYNSESASGGVPGHHNKFWMVDDHIFYFGSHNFYPSSLQQFGMIIDSTEAGNQVVSEFWDNLWSNADKSTDAFDPSQANCNS